MDFSNIKSKPRRTYSNNGFLENRVKALVESIEKNNIKEFELMVQDLNIFYIEKEMKNNFPVLDIIFEYKLKNFLNVILSVGKSKDFDKESKDLFGVSVDWKRSLESKMFSFEAFSFMKELYDAGVISDNKNIFTDSFFDRVFLKLDGDFTKKILDLNTRVLSKFINSWEKNIENKCFSISSFKNSIEIEDLFHQFEICFNKADDDEKSKILNFICLVKNISEDEDKIQNGYSDVINAIAYGFGLVSKENLQFKKEDLITETLTLKHNYYVLEYNLQKTNSKKNIKL